MRDWLISSSMGVSLKRVTVPAALMALVIVAAGRELLDMQAVIPVHTQPPLVSAILLLLMLSFPKVTCSLTPHSQGNTHLCRAFKLPHDKETFVGESRASHSFRKNKFDAVYPIQ